MLVLGIESSCDETGVAIYDTERGLIGNQLHTQIAMHAQYGGVVPELASRDHIHRLVPLTRACLTEAQVCQCLGLCQRQTRDSRAPFGRPFALAHAG